ncbi:hotdog fold thioesterase [Nocardioides nanhaiensis]|uniref:Thioesterase domain-containing protein n=1 Tax=Nocardioides nanhaiensis TaxID=1476871 RepID=A0ABP8X264_9ACTN
MSEETTDPTDAAVTADAAQLLERMPMGALNEKMGVRFLEVSAERIVATMPVEGNTQPYGLLHGGASVVLAETLGSTLAALHAEPLGKLAVGVDINATHHRSATSGLVTGTATPVHRGRSMVSVEVVVTDERDRRVCTSRITCALISTDQVQSKFQEPADG